MIRKKKDRKRYRVTEARAFAYFLQAVAQSRVRFVGECLRGGAAGN